VIAIGELLVFLLLGALVVTPAVLIPALVSRARRRSARSDRSDRSAG
jgi:hypothetical protein